MFLSPFDLDDAVEQANKGSHAALNDKCVGPSDALISGKQSQFVHLAYLNLLRISLIIQIANKVVWNYNLLLL